MQAYSLKADYNIQQVLSEIPEPDEYKEAGLTSFLWKSQRLCLHWNESDYNRRPFLG